HTGATATVALICRWQAADIAKVVVGPQQRNIVRHTHATLVKALHFFVQRPHLWHAFYRLVVEGFEQYLPLISNDLLQQLNIVALTHWLVFLAAHAEGKNTLQIFMPFRPLLPELINTVTVGGVLPRAFAVAVPLFVGAHHRLMMAGAHHYAHFVGQNSVLPVIIGKSVVPHRWPEKIGF